MAASTQRVGFRRRFRYHFDNALLRGSAPVLLWLAGVTGAVVALGAILVWLTGWGPEDQATRTYRRASGWLSRDRLTLGRSARTGVDGSDLITLLVTIAGVFILATIIALVTTALQRRLKKFRKGPLVRGRGGSSADPGLVDKKVPSHCG